MIELTGRRLGLDNETASDYEAFHERTALVDMSDRGRMRFSGARARDALNGVLTCDVAALVSGTGAYGVALTSKGKVVADVSVFANTDSFLVECPASAWAGWQQLVAKYINPRLAARIDETATSGSIGLFGPQAPHLAANILDLEVASLESLPVYSHVDCLVGGSAVNVARVPDMGVEGYRVNAATAAIESLRAAAVRGGARPVGVHAVECARIEAGRPTWGIDMDDSTLPQEANLEALGAISFTKGCYTGQEIVARLHFRGHVNRRLVGLRIDGTRTPARGTEVTTEERTVCGDIRSSILSPRFGPIALAMIRREVEKGAQVSTLVDGIEVKAEVITLPFGDG